MSEDLAKKLYTTKEGVRLNIGCGKEWIELKDKHGFDNMDIYDFGQKYVHDIRTGLPFEDDSIDFMRASHFMEHLTPDEAIVVLNECWRVLKKKSVFHIIVPCALEEKTYTLTHRSFWTRKTFENITRKDSHVYGINAWVVDNLVKNERGDVHAYIRPRK